MKSFVYLKSGNRELFLSRAIEGNAKLGICRDSTTTTTQLAKSHNRIKTLDTEINQNVAQDHVYMSNAVNLARDIPYLIYIFS